MPRTNIRERTPALETGERQGEGKGEENLSGTLFLRIEEPPKDDSRENLKRTRGRLNELQGEQSQPEQEPISLQEALRYITKEEIMNIYECHDVLRGDMAEIERKGFLSLANWFNLSYLWDRFRGIPSLEKRQESANEEIRMLIERRKRERGER